MCAARLWTLGGLESGSYMYAFLPREVCYTLKLVLFVAMPLQLNLCKYQSTYSLQSWKAQLETVLTLAWLVLDLDIAMKSPASYAG